MKKGKNGMIGVAMAVILALCPMMASAAGASDFSDVKPGSWYYNAVDYAATEGLFAGTGGGKFSPNVGMTRGMFVTVLGRKSGVSEAKPAKTSFTDVKPNDWFAPYVEWAAVNGIVSGVGGGRFDPNARISREQMATILYRYSQKTGNEGIQNGTEILKFPDTGAVADWAKEAMTWAVDKKILNGSDGKLDPKGTATRAQVAQVFLNAKDVLVKTDIVQKPQDEPDPEVPVITLTPEQLAALAPQQDPQEVVRLVSAGTTAKWDNSLNEDNAYEIRIMSFGDVLSDEYTPPEEAPGSTSHAAFNALEYLNNTGADRFTIAAGFFDGKPSMILKLYFTVPATADSEIMRNARNQIEAQFPNAQFSPDTIVNGHGWRGVMSADSSLSTAENASRVAKQELRYLTEWHSTNDSFTYWISEPQPGKFYFFY